MKYKLKDLLEEKGYIRGPFGSALVRSELKEKGIPVYEQQHAIYNIRDFRFYIDEEKFNEMRRFCVREDDLLISCSGTVGKVTRIKKNDPIGIISQALLILRVNKTKVFPEYLKYFFESKEGYNSIVSRSSGSVQVNIAKREIIEGIELEVPEKEEQHRIVNILKSLDDKIELNNAINKNLEEMAQALFKRWFVDFEFPNENGEPYKSSGGEFEESELGLIPKGWRVGILDDLCEMIFSGGTPSTKNEAYWNGDLFWLSSGETRNRYIISTEKRITQDGVENSSTRLAKKYDVVIASAGQGSTRGQTSICLVDTYINQSIIAVRAKKGSTFPSYLFFNLSTRYEELRQISDSNSIRGSLTTNTLKKLKIIIPPIEIQYKICSVLDQVINCAEYYQRQNEYLTQIRDTLLPKLMSGEIRVPVEQDHNDPDLPMVAESSVIYQP
ncbi:MULTISPECIES: restriction endonuclease subunit S [unclassified Paenibacillus]|uniref:restriction endonuclease subunit S n=1 Tax=unclassified Paenibacillus TaxID=185978 RepID=UPI002118372B|nr:MULTISPECIES: restriction endonuclease subunit S [unclassified Paenibacillus]